MFPVVDERRGEVTGVWTVVVGDGITDTSVVFMFLDGRRFGPRSAVQDFRFLTERRL